MSNRRNGTVPKRIPLSRIVHLYQKKGMNMRQVAAELGVSHQAISYRLIKAGVPRRSGQPDLKYPPKELIWRLYIEERLGVPSVARRLNESPHRIERAMDEYGIERRGRGGLPKYPQLRELAVGESIDLPMSTKNPWVNFYLMAKKAGIRVSVHVVNERTVKVTRIA